MLNDQNVSEKKISAARARITETADRLFYNEGLHSVGVDRVISEARVTRVTFYRHFPSKEALILAYLSNRDVAIRARFAAGLKEFQDPRTMLMAGVQGIIADACGSGARGCPFINAAAEFPLADHPVRQIVSEHRAWFKNALWELLKSLGHPRPENAASALVLLRDGAMVGGYLDDKETVAASLTAAVTEIVGTS